MHVNLTEEEVKVIQVAMNIADDAEQMAEVLGVTKERAVEIMEGIDRKLADK